MVTTRLHANGERAVVERLADGGYIAWERRGDGGTGPLRFAPTEAGLALARLMADRTAHPGGCSGVACEDWTPFDDTKR
jgi:hypothetical protein